jgi:hypothetical protein
VGLLVDFIQKEAAHAFIEEVKNQELKQHLLMGGKRSLNEALTQDLKLVAAKATAGKQARLRGVTRVAKGSRSPPAECHRDGRPVCWQCGESRFPQQTVDRDLARRSSVTGLEMNLCNQRKGKLEEKDADASDDWRLILQPRKGRIRS